MDRILILLLVLLAFAGVTGFTKGQREWIKRRDGERCMFHWFDGKSWRRCANTQHLQVHHVIPRGWASKHMPEGFPVNGCRNGITLCPDHHISEFGVHPDTSIARDKYRGGNKEAYKEMVSDRAEKNRRGVPYWNTMWDWMFGRLTQKHTAKYTREHPEDRYPSNSKRGLTGRKK